MVTQGHYTAPIPRHYHLYSRIITI